MTRTEVDGFRAALTARIAELERVTYHRDAIRIERSADQLEAIQAVAERTLAVCDLARKPSTATLPATCPVALRDVGRWNASALELMRTVMASDNVCVRRVL
jgi:hypothetical protein